MSLEIVAVNQKDPSWVWVRCTNPACRGREGHGIADAKRGGFLTQVRREEAETKDRIECSECFCR